MRTRAFTMIELAVVLMIVAISAAVVTLRIDGPMHRAQMEDVVGRVAQFDRLTREYARQHDRALRLVVHVGDREIRRTNARELENLGASLILPGGFRIEQMRLRGEVAADRRSSLACSRHGLTPTYALQLRGPGGELRWIVFAGLTGELIDVEEEWQVQEIFDALTQSDHAG